MRTLFSVFLSALFFLNNASAQEYSGKVHPKLKALGTVNLSSLPEVSVGLKTKEIAQPVFKRIDSLKPGSNPIIPKGGISFKKTTIDPVTGYGFTAQSPSGTPLDNNLAISNNGKILSAVNTTIRVYDSTGTILYGRSLAAIANSLGTLNRTFDPHVLYDPEEDKFILVFLNGSDHTNTNVIVGFSQSNDPAGNWNFYKIAGNTTQEEWWSDYPFIGLSKNELFISVLLWKDGDSGWDTDAVDENIWQIGKKEGYAGDSLETVQYHGLSVSGRPLWNIRPVSMGDQLYGPDFYLITNRPKDLNNDSLFLIHVSGEIADPNRKLTIETIKSSQAYGLQPNVTQLGGRRLRTNYCDIHEAYRLHNSIYFTGNSINTSSQRPGVYIGRISDLNTNPKADGFVFGVDSLDLNYPSIAYAGAGWPDQSAMVLCLHNSENAYPGSSAFMVGRDFSPSALIRLKEGLGPMNILAGDSLERWGDYTGAQRRFSNPGEVWVAGSFGLSNNTSQTWIAQLFNEDPQLSVAPQQELQAKIYPNPGQSFTLEFELKKTANIRLRIVDASGKEKLNSYQELNAGQQQLQVNLEGSSGIYFLEVWDESYRLIRKKLIKN